MLPLESFLLHHVILLARLAVRIRGASGRDLDDQSEGGVDHVAGGLVSILMREGDVMLAVIYLAIEECRGT